MSSNLIYCTHNTANPISTVATVSTAHSTRLTTSSFLDLLKLVTKFLSVMKLQLYRPVHQNLPFHSMPWQSHLGQYLTQHFHNLRCNAEFLLASKFLQLGFPIYISLDFSWSHSMRPSNGNVSGHNSHTQYSAAYNFHTTTLRVQSPLCSATPHYSCARYSLWISAHRCRSKQKSDLVPIVIFLKTGK
jgi:hypothetical protein